METRPAGSQGVYLFLTGLRTTEGVHRTVEEAATDEFVRHLAVVILPEGHRTGFPVMSFFDTRHKLSCSPEQLSRIQKDLCKEISHNNKPLEAGSALSTLKWTVTAHRVQSVQH